VVDDNTIPWYDACVVKLESLRLQVLSHDRVITATWRVSTSRLLSCTLCSIFIHRQGVLNKLNWKQPGCVMTAYISSRQRLHWFLPVCTVVLILWICTLIFYTMTDGCQSEWPRPQLLEDARNQCSRWYRSPNVDTMRTMLIHCPLCRPTKAQSERERKDAISGHRKRTNWQLVKISARPIGVPYIGFEF
jgi:hypothetical protein